MDANHDLDLTCINSIRTLPMDAVQTANSRYLGTPMVLAPVAYCLWQQFLCFDPQDPIWPNCTTSRSRSAPLKDLVKKFGFTLEHVVTAQEQLHRAGARTTDKHCKTLCEL